MNLGDLKMYHVVGDGPCPEPMPGAFSLQTCQRVLMLWSGPFAVDVPVTESGEAAYERLLRILCGLESRLQGETEVLGQFREAFTEQSPRLAGPVRRILRDALQRVREIRARHLSDFAPVSYGRILRKILELREGEVPHLGPVKIIGSGKLAASILPHLRDWPVWIWGRNREAVGELAGRCRDRLHFEPRILSNMEEPGAGVEVRCVPVDLGWGGAGPHTHVHFGTRALPVRPPGPGEAFYHLEDIFRFSDEWEKRNEDALTRARAACRVADRVPVP